jgi:hypothetical protein
MPVTLLDILHPGGVENPSGLATTHGIALFADMTTVQKAPDLSDGGATLLTIGKIATPHVFAAGKCMLKLYGTENKGEHKDDVVGDTDSQAIKDTGTLMIPGSKDSLNGTARVLNCTTGLLFTEEADGTVRQHGSERFPCHFKMAYATGNNEGYRGYTLTWTCYGPSAIYTSGLNFTPAEA